MQDGYADTYRELIDSTDWSKYGYESGNPKCANCMLHSGYEATAVDYTFTLKGMFAAAKAMFSPRYKDAAALRDLEAEMPMSPLVQIEGITAKPTLQGAEVAQSAAGFENGIEEAFDYRGDVTVTLKSGDQLEGYIFDRVRRPEAGASKIRIMLKQDRKKVAVSYAEIERLSFSGRDMADGKSWEAWVKKYAEKKAAGEQGIELTPEAMD